MEKYEKRDTKTINWEFEITHGSFSVSDNLDYFKCIIKKREALIDNLPVRHVIHVNKIENRIKFKIKRLLS